MFPLVLSLVAALPQPPQGPIDLPQIQNGSFADVVSGVGGGANVASTLWCGAEGKVQTSGGVSYVALTGGERAFQGVAKAYNQNPTLAFSLQARPRNHGDVGLVTISQGSDRMEALNWRLTEPSKHLAWSASELTGSGWVPMNPPDNITHAFTSTSSVNSGQRIDLVDTTVSGSVQAEWDVDTAGGILCLVRPVLASQGPVTIDVLKVSGATTTSIGSYTLTSTLPEGRDLILDVPVLDTDVLIFRATNQGGATNPAKVVWRPAVRHREKRITYVLSDVNPGFASSAEEKFVVVPGITPGAWNQVSPLFEADYLQQFGRSPKAPFLFELRGFGSGTADFTAVSGTHARTIESYASLRTDVMAEAERIFDLYRSPTSGHPTGIRDDVNVPTRWQLEAMHPANGPVTVGSIGRVPSNLLTLLRVRFSEREYDDLMSMVRPMFSPANRLTASMTPTALWFPDYNCATDQWDHATTATTGVGAGHLALEAYHYTGDVTFLQAAHDYAKVIAQNGFVTNPADVRVGLLLAGGYSVVDGTNPLSLPNATLGLYDLTPWGGMEAPSFLARVIGELMAYEQANPGKLDLTALPTIKLAAKSAIERCNVLRVFDVQWMFYLPWGPPWYHLPYQFSDIYGYSGIDATVALDALGPFVASDATVAQMHQTLLSYVSDGARAFLPPWELNTARSAPNAGDQTRAWYPYMWLIEHAAALGLQIDTPRIRTQLLRVARRFASHQMPMGVWVNGNEDEFYAVDIAGGGATPLHAPTFTGGFAAVLRADPTNTQIRDELLTRAKDVFRATIDYFVDPVSFPFGYKPSYYAGSPLMMTETRVMDVYLEAIAGLDRLYGVVGGAPQAAVSIQPADFEPAPPAGTPKFFRFTVTAPPGESLTSMLTNRTRIRLHTLSAGSWSAISIWPATQWAISLNGQTATLDYLVPMTAGSVFKFEVVSWTADGRWDSATSYQPW